MKRQFISDGARVYSPSTHLVGRVDISVNVVEFEGDFHPVRSPDKTTALAKRIAQLLNEHGHEEPVVPAVAYFLPWEESERNWGTRPDGVSLHISMVAAEKYVKDYWSRMPKETPDEYSRPVTEVPTPIKVHPGWITKLQEQGGSIRTYKNDLKDFAEEPK